MKVMAIDPGYDRLGVAVLEHTASGEALLYSTCIVTDRKMVLHDRLASIGDQIADLLKTHSPDSLAIETIFFNKNTTTVIGVAEVRGIIIYLATKAGCRIYEYGPQEVKVAITGYGKSDKTAVFSMVRRLIANAPVAALDDEYDAIAIGVTCLAQNGRSR